MQFPPAPSQTLARQPAAARGGLQVVSHLLHWVLALIGATLLFVAYQHLSLEGSRTPAYLCLAGSALLILNPLKALLHALFSVERSIMHLAHLIAGLALVALPVSGVVSGAPLLSHAAMAPFAIMGAAQALMHSTKPRSAAQAEALKNFVSSMPEVAQFTSSRDFASPENLARAVRVLNDLIGKAQVLGQTELDADPNFQSALQRLGVRTGVGLSLDAVQHSIDTMATIPAAAAAVPALRARLEQARRTLAKVRAASKPASGSPD